MRIAAVVLLLGLGACNRCGSDPPAKGRTGAAGAATGSRVDPAAAQRFAARAQMTDKARVRSVAMRWEADPPGLPTTVVAWAAAETSGTAESWDAAAEAYAAEVSACETECQESSYAEVLARKNALMASGIEQPSLMEEAKDPVPMPPRVQEFVDSLDRYIEQAAPDDADVAGMQFLAARTEAVYRQPDAIDRLEAILMSSRTHETAEYAANILLNELVRREMTDELRKWVQILSSDAVFLSDKPDLADTLRSLRQMLAMN